MTRPPRSLAELATDRRARVQGVACPSSQPDWPRQLAEIGFTPGEMVCVLHRTGRGGDPMVIRVGTSTFALRRAEAACVQIEPIEPIEPIERWTG